MRFFEKPHSRELLVFPFFPIAGFAPENQVFVSVAGAAALPKRAAMAGLSQCVALNRRCKKKHGCLNGTFQFYKLTAPSLYEVSGGVGKERVSRGNTAFQKLGTCFFYRL
jgi:hypothetical protein